MARKKDPPPQPAGCPAWLATYGDMVTLVLTFFVLLYSFSSLDVAKWQSFVADFVGKEPAYVNNVTAVIPNPPAVVDRPSTDAGIDMFDQSWSDLYDNITKFFDLRTDPSNQNQNQNQDNPDIGFEETRIIITLPETMLFDSGQYILRPDAVQELTALMDYIGDELNLVRQIVIEGHTDTVPVVPSAEIKNNMHLSFWRADAVLNALMASDLGLPYSLFACRAQGEEYPYYERARDAGYTGDRLDGEARRQWVESQNRTPEQRQRNRRCVIILERLLSPP
ncbi:MAG: OmpA family protein [Oscillospiraceae bacterium]|nr:OmpA family protein [Oscillospiraceae bacterium]